MSLQKIIDAVNYKEFSFVAWRSRFCVIDHDSQDQQYFESIALIVADEGSVTTNEIARKDGLTVLACERNNRGKRRWIVGLENKNIKLVAANGISIEVIDA